MGGSLALGERFYLGAAYESSIVEVDASIRSPLATVSTSGNFDLVTTRGRLRPMDFSILDDLVASGDLDPAIRDAMPTYSLSPWMLTWTPDLAVPTVCDSNKVPGCTIDYGMCVSSSSQCGANNTGATKPGPE